MRATWAILGALVVLAGAQFVTLFVRPPEPSLRTSYDAIVVLSGDHGDRLELGLSLVGSGRAPVLVILNPDDGPAARSRPLCGQDRPFAVTCDDPAVVSTAGDLAELRRLGRQQGWRRILIVTSRFHVARTRVILARCGPGGVDVVGSTPRFGLRTWGRAAAHEAGGIAQAVTTLDCG